ncbi:hypothetical protein DPX16_7143 [Anabarilius grahami]|uniref:Uncharacterized protein n=1 Tax=Anabarilius grahami TaxID=495550 RepID=A0A3N0XFI1_ANAGA|nr:hypothetical protein DPX16_7143 [Anabarilius grahami]
MTSTKPKDTLHRQTPTNADNHQITARDFSDIPRPDKCRMNIFKLRKQAQTDGDRANRPTRCGMSFVAHLTGSHTSLYWNPLYQSPPESKDLHNNVTRQPYSKDCHLA